MRVLFAEYHVATWHSHTIHIQLALYQLEVFYNRKKKICLLPKTHEVWKPMQLPYFAIGWILVIFPECLHAESWHSLTIHIQSSYQWEVFDPGWKRFEFYQRCKYPCNSHTLLQADTYFVHRVSCRIFTIHTNPGSLPMVSFIQDSIPNEKHYLLSENHEV